MEERQARLDKKVTDLQRARLWSGVLAVIAALVATVQICACAYVAVKVIGKSGMDTYWSTHWPDTVEVLLWAFFWLLGAWWLRRVRDAFAAIVDMIGELSETI